MIGLIRTEDVLYLLNSAEILGIIYLAIAVSKLRERIAKLEGKVEQRLFDKGEKL